MKFEPVTTIQSSPFRSACLAVLVMSAPAFGDALQSAQAGTSLQRQDPVLAAPVELRIIASEFAFRTDATQVPAGQPVVVVLDNANGETEHSVFIPALSVRIFARAGGTGRREVFFAKAGEYEFICDLPGHVEAGMKGKILVTNSGQAQRR